MRDPSAPVELASLVAASSAIVFDWNGTILDDAERALSATNGVLAVHALAPLDMAGFRTTFCLPLTDYFLLLGLPCAGIDEAIPDWNRRLAGGPIALSAGVPEMLAAANRHGIPVGIVSAAGADVVRADACALGIDGDLTFIVGDARSKSRAIREIAERFDGRVLYCGDTEYDISEAQDAGAFSIAFGGGYRPARELLRAEPDLLIDDFFAIARAIELAGGSGQPVSF